MEVDEEAEVGEARVGFVVFTPAPGGARCARREVHRSPALPQSLHSHYSCHKLGHNRSIFTSKHS